MPISTTWRNLRKICNLHIFASQKLDANQNLRRNKVEQLIADVGDSSHIGESIEISTFAFKTTLNLISNIVFSIDYADSSSNTALEFREILLVIKESIRRRMAIHSKKMMNIFDKEIEKRSELRKMNDYIPAQDFLDSLLQISEDDNEELDRNLIKHLFFDLFTAGTDTTTTEVDIKIHNFVIPKGAQVLINAWAIGRDPNFWEEPELFSLERFIESEVDVKGTNFGLIPFGGGRRICPGLLLAIRMLPLMLGALIHSFDWELEGGVTPQSLNMDETYGLILQKAQPLKVIPRSI
ncbi:geraniol 8-hydroxylase-like [Gossypium australe]|uniref:Geraniol 8-hydroxylase-like n=1 Tax=Gossypium australe TaxID=47621 RepID=A0A5B6VIY6_9ROSI|nr:geraniol 8-hydroxylase-like [Gossypium australe]